LKFQEEPTPPPLDALEIETPLVVSPHKYRDAQRAAVARQIEATGIEATGDLLTKLSRKAQFYRVTGFVVAAHIGRAWNRIRA